MTLKIKESELKDILAEVADDLAKAFKSTEGQLAKAELRKDDGPPKDDESGDDSAPPAEGSEGGSSEGSSAPPAGGDAGGPPAPDASAAPDASPSPDGMDPAAEMGQALTPEALQAEYAKLPPEELDMHIKAALAAKAAQAGSPDAGMGAPPPAGPPMDASAGSPAGAPPPMPPPGPAMKAELPPSPERKGEHSIDRLGKSEFEAFSKKASEEIAALKAIVENQSNLVKNQAEEIETLTKIAQKLAEQPLRKAVTSVAHLPKVEAAPKEWTRASIQARLKEVSARPNLAKSDRQLINDWYDGRVKIDKLAHLFEDAK